MEAFETAHAAAAKGDDEEDLYSNKTMFARKDSLHCSAAYVQHTPRRGEHGGREVSDFLRVRDGRMGTINLCVDC